jgi:CheY-like chemotaxis protein
MPHYRRYTTTVGLLASHPEVQLLLTDVILPGGMTGRQLADEAVRRQSRLKVLYRTATRAMRSSITAGSIPASRSSSSRSPMPKSQLR